MVDLKNMKKIELHLHLDGSLKSKTVLELLKDDTLRLENVEKMLTVSKECKDLTEYLEKFELPIKIMQNKENLERIAYELVEDLKKENVIYAEIRFAPALHTRGGLNFDEIVTSVLKGLNNSAKVGNIKCNLILCCMRGKGNEKENIETVNVAKRYLNKGVCAIDLAGAEAIYETNEFEYIFELAKKLKIPYTIHAGEIDNKKSMESAILFGTKRLGHGMYAIKYEDLIEKIIENDIVLEICPTSNVHTKAVDSIKEHPIYELYKKNVKVTVNTDNRTVSNITLTKEYEYLLDNFDLTIDNLLKMNKNAIMSAFLTKEEKQELLKIL